MKKIFSIFGAFLFVVFILSPGYLTAQDGSPLTDAVAYQDLDKVKELVKAGENINFQTEAYGYTALFMACSYNFIDIATYLIENGADVSIKSHDGRTALMGAAVISEELFDLLISKGADITVKLEDGTSAFTMSIIGVLSDYIGLGNAKKLLDNGADVDEAATSGPTEGYTCLMMAAGNKRLDIAKFLVEEGADVNAKSADGTTPISMAEKNDDPEMVAFLKEHGAN